MNRPSKTSVVAICAAAAVSLYQGCRDFDEIEPSTDASTDTDADSDTDTDIDTDTATCPEEQIWSGDYAIESGADLQALSGYTAVTGDLLVAFPHTDSPANLDGLQCLQSLGGNLRIDSPNLASLGGLNNLAEVGGELHITHAGELTSLHGLDSLTTIGTLLIITSTDQLEDLTGLESLSSVLEIGLQYNEALVSLEGLEGFGTTLPSLFLEENPSLTSLAGLEWADAIACSLQLVRNYNLEDLSGLESVTAIGWRLIITNNDDLADIGALDSLETLGELSVECSGAAVDADSDSDTDCSIEQDGFLSVTDNDSLPSCDVVDLAARVTAAGFDGCLLFQDNLGEDCTEPCSGYAGDDLCCVLGDPCGWAENDACDCDSTCDWDAVDCEW